MIKYCVKCGGKGWVADSLTDNFSSAEKAFIFITTLGIVPIMDAMTSDKIRCDECSEEVGNS